MVPVDIEVVEQSGPLEGALFFMAPLSMEGLEAQFDEPLQVVAIRERGVAPPVNWKRGDSRQKCWVGGVCSSLGICVSVRPR